MPNPSNTNSSPLVLTRAAVREIDRGAMQDYGIPGIVLMENAGRGAAACIAERIGRSGIVSIVCGGGNNGGDGYVIARHLANSRADVRVFAVVEPERLPPDAQTNHEIVRRMGISMHPLRSETDRAAAAPLLAKSEVVVDALLGTGFSGELRSPVAQAIAMVNAVHGAWVAAVDIPSGLDCDTGQAALPTVRANLTATFVALKPGLIVPEARAYVGQVCVVDIGVPLRLIAGLAGTFII